MTILQILWFFLIFVLIAGYFVLDGFDLGAGVLYPVLAKNETERAYIRRSIGPVWDGNEVWLLTAGGALFAAFPAAYATTFSGFYLAVMLVLFGLIVRAVSLEFRAHDASWSRVWDVCFIVGSFLPALLLGVAVGNAFAGIPMAANGDYSGVPLLGLITPYTLLVGLLGFAMCLTAGCLWIALKTPEGSDLRARARKLEGILQIVTLVLFAVCGVMTLGVIRPAIEPAMWPVACVFALLFAIALIVSIYLGRAPYRASGDVDVPDARRCRSCRRGRLDHRGDGSVLGDFPCLDDGHRVYRRAARVGVPRHRLPHVPWPLERGRRGVAWRGNTT